MKLVRFNRPNVWDWSPGTQLSSLRHEINRLFDAPFSELSQHADFFSSWTPAMDVHEDKDNLVLMAELPGMKKEEIDIWFEDGVLNIAGERKHETETKDKEFHRTERFQGKFHRSFTLPKPVDAEKISASYTDGVLTVTLPKTEAARPKQIEVKVQSK